VAVKNTKLVSIVILGCLLATSVGAQSTRERLDRLEAQVGRMDRVVNNNDSQTDMLRKLNELQAENQALRNEIETLQFESKRAADQQRQLYMDLDERMQGVEAGGAGVAQNNSAITVMGGAATIAGGGTAGGSEQDQYQAAFELLKAGRYDEAAAGFSEFLAAFPTSDLRDNAQYWLAETHYVSQDFVTALDGFQSVVSDFPASRKIPDSWLKIGYCNYELKRWDAARQALNVVASRFPETTAARLATQRLQMMDTAGQ
jgi:tol-pal system protein YbgF